MAEGNVTLLSSDVLMNGSRMDGYLLGGTGTIENAFGIGPGDVYFRGTHIEQFKPGAFRIQNGVVTPCTQALPIWEFSARTFDLFADDHVRVFLQQLFDLGLDGRHRLILVQACLHLRLYELLTL